MDLDLINHRDKYCKKLPTAENAVEATVSEQEKVTNATHVSAGKSD